MHLSVTFIQTSKGSIINTYIWKKYNFDKSQHRLAVGVIYPVFFLPPQDRLVIGVIYPLFFLPPQDKFVVGVIYLLLFLPLPLLLLNQTSSHTTICQSPSISSFNSTFSIVHSIVD